MKKKKEQGFIENKLLFDIVTIGALLVICYFTSIWGKEYYKIKVCENCTHRMQLIEDAKKMFRNDHPGGKPDLYSDLLPYLSFTGFPTCPWGGKYEHELDINQVVTCSLNGNPLYTPNIPGVDPKKNGYMNLSRTINPIGLLEFLKIKILRKPLQKGELNEKQKEIKRIFRD